MPTTGQYFLCAANALLIVSFILHLVILFRSRWRHPFFRLWVLFWVTVLASYVEFLVTPVYSYRLIAVLQDSIGWGEGVLLVFLTMFLEVRQEYPTDQYLSTHIRWKGTPIFVLGISAIVTAWALFGVSDAEGQLDFATGLLSGLSLVAYSVRYSRLSLGKSDSIAFIIAFYGGCQIAWNWALSEHLTSFHLFLFRMALFLPLKAAFYYSGCLVLSRDRDVWVRSVIGNEAIMVAEAGAPNGKSARPYVGGVVIDSSTKIAGPIESQYTSRGAEGSMPNKAEPAGAITLKPSDVASTKLQLPEPAISVQFTGLWGFIYLLWCYPSGRLVLLLLTASSLGGFGFLLSNLKEIAEMIVSHK